MEPSATSTTVTGPIGERLPVGTEDAPVLDFPVPLRRLHDSGTGYKYKYPDLLTYEQIAMISGEYNCNMWQKSCIIREMNRTFS